MFNLIWFFFQIKNESDNLESSFKVTDTRTDTLYTDVVKEELNTSADEHTDTIEDINDEQDNLSLVISETTTTASQVKEEINQDFDNVSFKFLDFFNLIMKSSQSEIMHVIFVLSISNFPSLIPV